MLFNSRMSASSENRRGDGLQQRHAFRAFHRLRWLSGVVPITGKWTRISYTADETQRALLEGFPSFFWFKHVTACGALRQGLW